MPTSLKSHHRRGGGFDRAAPTRLVHAVLLDIDHSPSHWLNPENSAFYTVPGLRNLADKLHPGGIFGLWSNDPPDAEFIRLLDTVFQSAESHIVTFPNPYSGGAIVQHGLPGAQEANNVSQRAASFGGTPREIINRFNAEMLKVLKDPDVRALMERDGSEPLGSTPDEFGVYFKREVEKYAKVIKASGARAE